MQEHLARSETVQTIMIGYSMAIQALPDDERMPFLLRCREEARSNFQNPDRRTIFQEISESCNLSSVDLSIPLNWLTIPWSSEKTMDMRQLFNTLVAHADYHKLDVDIDYFPPKLAMKFINGVIQSSQSCGRALTIPEQFSIAMDIANDNPTAAAILAHAGSRAIARNLDTRIDPVLKFGEDEVKIWNKSIARFPDDKFTDVLGDNYHFWAYCSMGMASRAKEELSPLSSLVTRALAYNGAEILEFARGLATLGKKPLVFKHSQIGKLGIIIGSSSAAKFISPQPRF